MPETSGIYDSGPIVPVCKIMENLAVLSGGDYHFFQVLFVEPLPRSSPMIADMVQIVQGAAGPGIAAGGILNQTLIPYLRINKGVTISELLHLRFEPIDDVECLLWETASVGRFATNFVRARVSRFTAARDPFLSSSTIFIMGQDNDINIGVANPNAVLVPQARVAFWGYRYHLGEELKAKPANVTYVVAEGKGVGGR